MAHPPRITLDNECGDGGSGTGTNGGGSSVGGGRPLPSYPPLPPNAANFMAGVEAERRAISRLGKIKIVFD